MKRILAGAALALLFTSACAHAQSAGAVFIVKSVNGDGTYNLCAVGTTGCDMPTTGGGGGGGGSVFGPTATGSPAANPPVQIGGTINGGATGNVQGLAIK